MPARFNPENAKLPQTPMTSVIDLHIHIMPHEMMKPAPMELITRGRTAFEEVERFCHDPKLFLKYLDSIQTERAGLINYVAPEIIGFTPAVNDWGANFAKDDRIAKLGIRAIKIHPSHQALTPNSYLHGNTELRKIYDRAQHHRLPIMIHTGTSIFPGARNTHAQPILTDDIGVDFPDLAILLAHGGRPIWMAEAFFLVRRHKNFHMDISGIPPQKLLEYFPRIEDIADKVLWGTDWPSPGVNQMNQNVAKFRALPLSAATQQKILHDNAAALFPK